MPKADWFVWAESKPDGSPPNNWLSVFGGSAWQWDTGRCQYYMHNFLASQPDLNFHNEEVQKQILEVAKFWLERGVHGFRLDTLNFYFHDKELRDNPPWGDTSAHRRHGRAEQSLRASKAHLRQDATGEPRLSQTPACAAQPVSGHHEVGEIGSDDPFATIAEYTSENNKLQMAYLFNLLTREFSAKHIRETVEEPGSAHR